MVVHGSDDSTRMLIVMDAAATPEDIRRVVDSRPGPRPPGAPHPRDPAHRDRHHRQPRHRRSAAPSRTCPASPRSFRVSAPYKLVSREAKRENTVVSVGGVPIGRRAARLHRRALRGRVARSRPSRSAARVVEAGRARSTAAGPSSRAPSPYSFQGLGRGGPQDPRRGARGDRAPIVTEVLDTETRRARRGARRLPPDRRAQHAELLAPEASSAARQAGAAQARHVGHARGAAAGGRVPAGGGQLRGDPLRAGRAHLRRPHPQHARPLGRAGRPADLAPADPGRPVPRHRQARQGRSRCRARPSRSAPTGS